MKLLRLVLRGGSDDEGQTHISRGYMRVTLSPCLSRLPSSYREGLRPRAGALSRVLVRWWCLYR